MTLLMRKTLNIACTLSILFSLPSLSDAGSLPVVGSGTLVAQFQAGPNVAVDGSNNVTSWAAENNDMIVLNAMGSPASGLKYNATGMFGSPTIEANDTLGAAGGGDNMWVEGDILEGGSPLTQATFFMLGYFDPHRTPVGDGSGQYPWSMGTQIANGSQFDFQTDDGNAEFYLGGGTQGSTSIDQFEGDYTVFRVEYGGGAGDTWSWYADGVLQDSGVNGANYSVDDKLIVFAWQNSGSTSGGYNFTGNMSELLIYDSLLSSQDASQIESYLASRLPAPLDLQVNKTTGHLTIMNDSAVARDINFYEIRDDSSNNTLDAAWDSLSDQGIDPLEDPNGATPGAGNDPGETWTEAGGSNSNLLSELYLQGSTNLADGGGSVTMANGFTGGNGAPETLVFEYAEVGADSTTAGTVSYVTSLLGDMNADDVLDDADVPLFVMALVDRAAYNALGHYPPAAVDIIGDVNESGAFNLGDVASFKAAVPGVGSASSSAVPEPATLVLLVLGLMAGGRRRR